MLFYKGLLLSLIPLLTAAQFCMDDSDFTFPLDAGGETDCAWLTKNNSATRIDTYCGRGHVKGACQKSCDFCPCESNPNFSFKLLVSSASSPTIQECNWISKSNPLDRQTRYCFENDGVSASTIGTECVSDCGFCTGGSGTPAPSKSPVRSPPTSSTKMPTDSFTKEPTVTKSPTVTKPTSNTTPSAAPVTRRPTRTPTTKSPSRAPVTACADDADFKFNLDFGGEQDCAWLTIKHSATAKRTATYCGRGHVKGACQKTCKFCSCTDDTTFVFPLQSVNGEQNCEWLGKKNSASRQNKYCFEEHGRSASAVGNKCVASCGFCSA